MSDAAVFGCDIFFSIFGVPTNAIVLQEAYQRANRQKIGGRRERA